MDSIKPISASQTDFFKTFTEEYYLAVKKEWNFAILSIADGRYAKWNRSEKDKYRRISLYVESKNTAH